MTLLYDPLRAKGWSEERIQTWLRTPQPKLLDLSPQQLDATTLGTLIRLITMPDEPEAVVAHLKGGGS